MKTYDHIKHLITLTYFTGNILDDELDEIIAKAVKAGISLDLLETWLNNACYIISGLPSDEEACEKFLINLINTGLASSRCSESEYELCTMLVTKLPLPHLQDPLLFIIRKAKLSQLINNAAKKQLTRKDQDILNRAARNAGISVEELARLLSGKSDQKSNGTVFNKPYRRPTIPINTQKARVKV